MKRFLMMSVAILAVTGCGRMIDGSTQRMTIETPGANGAACFIENEEFRYKIYSPQTITITRSFYPLNVRCLAPGNRQKTVTVAPKVNEHTFMNAVNGFVPGMALDYNSRAFYKFPEHVVVDFTDLAPGPMPAPHHDRLFKDHPELRGWEEFRPGMPALQRDLYDEVPTLQRRFVPTDIVIDANPAATEAPAAEPAPAAPRTSDRKWLK